jgi:hypothetical protein
VARARGDPSTAGTRWPLLQAGSRSGGCAARPPASRFACPSGRWLPWPPLPFGVRGSAGYAAGHLPAEPSGEVACARPGGNPASAVSKRGSPTAMGPTTHANGKPTRSSRRARRGAGCWVEDDHGASRGRRYRAARLRGGWRRRPSSSHSARVHGWASRWGRGPLGDVGRSGDGRPRARFAPASLAVAVVRARPDGALACRPTRSRDEHRRRRLL